MNNLGEMLSHRITISNIVKSTLVGFKLPLGIYRIKFEYNHSLTYLEIGRLLPQYPACNLPDARMLSQINLRIALPTQRFEKIAYLC